MGLGGTRADGLHAAPEAGPKAKAAALRAIALDDELRGGARGAGPGQDLDRLGLGRRRAGVAASPRDQPQRCECARVLCPLPGDLGRTDEAIPHSERALELDPFNPLFHALYGGSPVFDRRYDDALAAARTALAMQPDMPVARSALYYSSYAMGMRDELLAERWETIAHDPERMAAFERGLAEAGYEGVQRRLADYWAARYGKPGGIRALHIAIQYLAAGNNDRALEFLEKATRSTIPTCPTSATLSTTPCAPTRASRTCCAA